MSTMSTPCSAGTRAPEPAGPPRIALRSRAGGAVSAGRAPVRLQDRLDLDPQPAGAGPETARGPG